MDEIFLLIQQLFIAKNLTFVGTFVTTKVLLSNIPNVIILNDLFTRLEINFLNKLSKNILIADDNMFELKQMSELLESYNFKNNNFSSALGALQLKYFSEVLIILE